MIDHFESKLTKVSSHWNLLYVGSVCSCCPENSLEEKMYGPIHKVNLDYVNLSSVNDDEHEDYPLIPTINVDNYE